MPVLSLRALLDRFRPAPPPGQPGPVGIPSQTPRSTVDELAALFLLVDGIDAECAEIKADGRRLAKHILDDAAAGAARIEADAAGQAKQARDTASRAVRGDAQTRAADMLASAQADAEEIRRRESAELDRRVDSAVDLVRAIGGEPAKRRG